jgi:2-iminoacetate synthase ThiH
MWFEISGQNMTSQKRSEFKTTAEDEHWRNEEFQWARILSSGNPAKGIVLLYIQKACTAFHEFEPSWKAGALDEGQIEFFRQRLAKRVRQVLVTMENNGLDTINGAAELSGVLRGKHEQLSCWIRQAVCYKARTQARDKL